MKISQVQKITLSALLLALTIILTRITPFQSIPVIPWVRVSLGPALIIFASIYLGPLYGAIVGAGSDILGILPWLIYTLIKRVKSPQIENICLISAAILIFAAVVYLMFLSPTIAANYSFETYQKWLIVSGAFVLLIATIVSIYFINKYYVKKYGEIFSPYKIAFIVTVSEILLMLLLNSLVKTVTFEVDFWIIFFAQAIVFFVDVPLNTFVVEGLLILANKIKR